MAVEIERKYLVKKDKWEQVDKGTGNRFSQGYILTDPEKTVRVRLTESEAFITIKGKTTGASRAEYEYTIPVQDAEELLSGFCSTVISKIRYKIQHEDHMWEVDEFSGDNAGLIIAEIELTSEGERFELPEWVGEEVTEDRRYYNSNLSLNPYKNWEK